MAPARIPIACRSFSIPRAALSTPPTGSRREVAGFQSYAPPSSGLSSRVREGASSSSSSRQMSRKWQGSKGLRSKQRGRGPEVQRGEVGVGVGVGIGNALKLELELAEPPPCPSFDSFLRSRSDRRGLVPVRCVSLSSLFSVSLLLLLLPLGMNGEERCRLGKVVIL